MRPVIVNKHARLVVAIIGVSTNVIAFLDDQACLTKLAGNPLGKDRARKACADDKEIEPHENANRNIPMSLRVKVQLELSADAHIV